VLSPGDDGSVVQSSSDSSASVAGDIAAVLQDVPTVQDIPAPPAASAFLPAADTTPSASATTDVGLDPVQGDPAAVAVTTEPPAPSDPLAAPATGGQAPVVAPLVSPPAMAPALGPTAASAPRPHGTGASTTTPSHREHLRPAHRVSAPQRRGAGLLGARHTGPGDVAPLLPAPSSPLLAPRAGSEFAPSVNDRHSNTDQAAHREASGSGAQLPILVFQNESASPLAGAAAHGGASSGGGLMALVAGFIFLSPGLTRWLRVGAERRPRLLRAGRRERPG